MTSRTRTAALLVVAAIALFFVLTPLAGALLKPDCFDPHQSHAIWSWALWVAGFYGHKGC